MTGQAKRTRYDTLVAHLRDVLIETADDSGERFAPMIVACDLAAEVILAGFPENEHLAVLELFLTRLGNEMDRKSVAGSA